MAHVLLRLGSFPWLDVLGGHPRCSVGQRILVLVLAE